MVTNVQVSKEVASQRVDQNLGDSPAKQVVVRFFSTVKELANEVAESRLDVAFPQVTN